MLLSLSKKLWLLRILIVAAVLFVFSSNLDGTFQFDDRHNITDNPSIHMREFSFSFLYNSFLSQGNANRGLVAVANALKQKRVRLSPRRVRRLAGNLLALTAVVGGAPASGTFQLGLRTSIPQPAWGVEVDDSVLLAAHEIAWSQAFLDGKEKWLNDLLLESKVERKIEKLLTSCPDEDTGSVGLKRLLAVLDPIEAKLLAFSLYPAALEGRVSLGTEGVAAMAKVAGPILDVNAEITWQERRTESGTKHPQLDRCTRALAGLRGKRKDRARQFFYHLVAEDLPLSDPEKIEKILNWCVLAVSKCLRKKKLES